MVRKGVVMVPLEIFGFRALWSPYFFITILLFVFLYFLLASLCKRSYLNAMPPSPVQSVSFCTAMVLLYIVKGSPVDLIGHILFSVHMLQMSILFFIVAPLFLRGMPVWILEKGMQLPVVAPVVRFFTNPVLAVITFNIIFSLYHIPAVFDQVKVTPFLHSIYTIVLFLLAIAMWWPILSPLPGQYALSGLKKIAYLFASAMLLTPACALIMFANHPVYRSFSDGTMWLSSMHLCVPADMLSGVARYGSPALFSPLPVLQDQQLGGVVMKIMQEIVYGIMLARIFFQWARTEQEDGSTEKNPVAGEQRRLMEQH